ncbi:hypothetical protein [Ensifer canadensis]
MKRALIAVVMTMGAATSSLAQNEPQYVMGVTGQKCSKLLSATSETDSPKSHIPMAMIAWMEGYVSGTNIGLVMQGQPPYDVVSMTAHEYWATIYGFCTRNPDRQVMEVIPDIFVRLKRREASTP